MERAWDQKVPTSVVFSPALQKLLLTSPTRVEGKRLLHRLYFRKRTGSR